MRFPTPARFPNKMTTNMAETTPSPSPTPRVDDFQLHECVFNADIKVLSKLLRSHDVSKKDKHGKHLILFDDASEKAFPLAGIDVVVVVFVVDVVVIVIVEPHRRL